MKIFLLQSVSSEPMNTFSDIDVETEGVNESAIEKIILYWKEMKKNIIHAESKTEYMLKKFILYYRWYYPKR